MGRKKDLTESQRGAIIYGHQRRDSLRTIAAAVGCSKSSVWNVIKEFSRSGAEAQKKKKKRPGRPKTLTQSDQENLKELVTNGNRRLNLLQITNLRNCHSEKKVSKSTVRRALHDLNLSSCVAPSKPLVSDANAKKRYEWALAHQDWTVDNFKRVLWSDETTIRLFQGSPGRVWREPHEKWEIDCIGCTVKRSPGRMYWGCFSWFGVGALVPLKSNATGASHLEILRRYVVPAINKFPSNYRRGRPTFVQDNARPHVATVAKEFLEEHRIRVMNWPPQSPDLNPIENLWEEVKQSIRRKNRPGSLDELDALAKKAWNDIPPELIRRLITSMPDRVAACIKAKGGPIKY